MRTTEENKPASEQFERLCRELKAHKLVLALLAAGVRSIAAKKMNESEWVMAAEMADVHPPSEQTRQLALRILRDHEIVSTLTELKVKGVTE